jgi:tetratricopeptide (TPR) repeat protein
MASQFLCVVILLVAGFVSAQESGSAANKAALQSAAQAISAGKLDKAENDLHSVLQSSPDESSALDLLGVIRILQHREPEGLDLFNRVVRNDPNLAPGRAHLGLLYLQMGRPQEAVPQLREALHLDPARTDAAGALVHILQDQSQAAVNAGKINEAMGLLNEARRIAPDNADVQYAFGLLALRLWLLPDAVRALQKTLELRKNDPLALYNLGRAFTELSKFEEARQQFAEYIRIRPDDPSGHCALGMTLAALERSQEARAEFERSIDMTPVQTESYYGLGLLELQSREFMEASAHFRQVLEREPANTLALMALGKAAFEQKHYEDAIPLLQQAIAHDDAMREAHYYLGLTFARTGRKAESAEQLEIATRLEHTEAERRRTMWTISEPPTTSHQQPSIPK